MCRDAFADDDLKHAVKTGLIDDRTTTKGKSLATQNKKAITRIRGVANRGDTPIDDAEQLIADPMRAASKHEFRRMLCRAGDRATSKMNKARDERMTAVFTHPRLLPRELAADNKNLDKRKVSDVLDRLLDGRSSVEESEN
jgi:hypothetical protein